MAQTINSYDFFKDGVTAFPFLSLKAIGLLLEEHISYRALPNYDTYMIKKFPLTFSTILSIESMLKHTYILSAAHFNKCTVERHTPLHWHSKQYELQYQNPIAIVFLKHSGTCIVYDACTDKNNLIPVQQGDCIIVSDTLSYEFLCTEQGSITLTASVDMADNL